VEDYVLVFISPIGRGANLYPQAPGSLFVSFYDWHGYIVEIIPASTWKFSVYTGGNFNTSLRIYILGNK
jgi:hypothetical protein